MSRSAVMPQSSIPQGATQSEASAEAAAREYFGDDYYGRDRFRKYLEYFPGDGPILDYGCGDGVFLNLLRSAGRVGKGIDYDRENVERGRQFGLDIEHADLLEFADRQEEWGKYDGIMMADFVEHFDPYPLQNLIRASLPLLSPKGTMVMITPNSRSVLMNLGGFYEATIEHHNLYSVAGLAKFLQHEGMEIVAGGVDPDSRSPIASLNPGKFARNLAIWGLGRILCGRDCLYEASFVVAQKSPQVDQQRGRFRTAATSTADVPTG
ncbi:MAG: class I SAM-dependent methyltransferase [Planctomycetota bacterium]